MRFLPYIIAGLLMVLALINYRSTGTIKLRDGENSIQRAKPPINAKNLGIHQKKKRYIGIALKFLVFYILWCIALFFLQDWLLFPRHAIPKYSIEPPPGSTNMWITGEDGILVEGWYLPPTKKQGSHPVVIFFHGNAEVIDFWSHDLQKFRDWGAAVFLPEFRGYGRSGGHPGQKEFAVDMVKFYDWLIKQPGVDTERIIYFGRSIGGGVACQLAKSHPPKVLILQSTFTSLSSMSKNYLAPPFLLKHPFNNQAVVAELDCPIFIMHGSQDNLISVNHGRQLSKTAKNVRYREIVDAGHNDVLMDNEYWRNIKQFLLDNDILQKK